MPGLIGMKRILALNDEAHHCYREKPAREGDEGPLKGDGRKEAERNREAARVRIAGLEAVQRKLDLQRVIDLLATTPVNGRLPLFRNFDEHGNRLACPRTLFIGSEQLDAGEALDKNFPRRRGREAGAMEAQFRGVGRARALTALCRARPV